MGAISNVGIATWMYDYDTTWWIAGLGGALIGSVWNFAVSAAFVWRQRSLERLSCARVLGTFQGDFFKTGVTPGAKLNFRPRVALGRTKPSHTPSRAGLRQHWQVPRF